MHDGRERLHLDGNEREHERKRSGAVGSEVVVAGPEANRAYGVAKYRAGLGPLSSHLRPPEYRIGLLPRPQLMAQLEVAGAHRLLLIHAPAGFGKTTLLYQWTMRLQSSCATVCWLTAGPGDSDPYRFVHHLNCSVVAACGLPSPQGVPVSPSFKKPELATDIEALVGVLAGVAERLVLIIDDYHVAESEENNQILHEVVNALGQRATVAISSRTKPALSLPYFKCQGLLGALDAASLKFSEEECDELFSRDDFGMAGRAVYRQCAGWPMALQLAKLWLREAGAHVARSNEIDANAAGITEYLSGEVVKRMPPDVKRMMEETAILEQVNGDVANYVTQRTDCWSLIDALDTLDGLIVPLAGKGGWFRYHQLFREFLQGQLARQGTAYTAGLHLRASEWFQRHGDIENAVAHSARAEDHDRVAGLIESSGAVRIGLTQGMPVLRRLLKYLSAERIYAHPRLHLAQIWLLAKEGEVGAAREQYDQCIGGGEDARTAYSDREKESLFVGLMLAEVYEDTDFNQQDIERIESMARDVSVIDHWFQGWVNNLLCIMHTRKGNLHSASAVNEAATFHYRQVGSDYGQVWMLLHHALISLLDGRLKDAERAIGEASGWASREFGNDTGLVNIIRIVESGTLLEASEVDRAAAVFDALTAAEKAEGWVEVFVQGYRTAIDVAFAQDGLEPALGVVTRAEHLARDRDLPRLGQSLVLFQIEILTLAGRLDEADVLVSAHRLSMEPEPRLGEDGWRERVQKALVLARLAIYQGRNAEVSQCLRACIADAERFGRRRAAMELAVMLAMAQYQDEDRDGCVASLRRALHTAVEEGFHRVFVREGRAMASMLDVMIRHIGVSSMNKETVAFLSGIVTSLNVHPSSDATRTPNILTDKELAVLAQSAQGNANKVIARNLDISVATVKFHLSNVYRKLGVGSRTMAVAVAQRNDLL